MKINKTSNTITISQGLGKSYASKATERFKRTYYSTDAKQCLRKFNFEIAKYRRDGL